MSTSPKRRWLRVSLWTMIVATVAISAVIGVRHYVWEYDWAMIQRATRLQSMHDAFDVKMMTGPAWHAELWGVAQFQIPPDSVAKFVASNECEASDRTELVRYRNALPREMQTLPSTGKHFYKTGETTSGKPFEILVDSSGLVIVYMMFDD